MLFLEVLKKNFFLTYYCGFFKILKLFLSFAMHKERLFENYIGKKLLFGD